MRLTDWATGRQWGIDDCMFIGWWDCSSLFVDRVYCSAV